MMAQKDTAYTRIMNFENAMCRRLDVSRMERYTRNYSYYSSANLPPDNVEQPLGINYAKTFNEKHAHYLFGQWDEGKDIINWQVEPVRDTDQARVIAAEITKRCYYYARQNNANILFFDAGLNGSIYGDSIFRVTFDKTENRVRWESVLPEYCHFRWSPHDLNQITEVIISYPMTREDAFQAYGTTGAAVYDSPNIEIATKGLCLYWELWSPMRYEKWIDDIPVDPGPNPTLDINKAGEIIPGVIPLVHLPNTRAGGEFYGFADAETAFLAQDELNRKLADQGDIINNFAHPITIINSFYGDVDDLPVGPDQVWDLGREGKATLLQWNGSSPAVKEYVETLMGIMFDMASISPVAYARHKGTQQSAIALAIEMMPITERSRWKRMYWSAALRRMVRLSVYLDLQNGVKLPFTWEQFIAHDIDLVWAPTLPRDRTALVQENVVLTLNHLRSFKKALISLGEKDPDGDWAAILKDAEKLAELIPQMASGAGGSGSSSMPDGPTEAKVKGRPTTQD